MKKFIFLLLLALAVPKPSYANENFLVAAEVTYEVPESGNTKVTHRITIANATTEVHATDYTLSLRGAHVSEVSAYWEGGEYQTEVAAGDIARIKIIFDEPVVGIGNSRNFTLEYVDSSVVEKSGDIAEISIPKLEAADFNSYLVRLKVPASFGEHAYVSPAPDNVLQTAGFATYYFDKLNVAQAGVSAAFGEFQVFSFDLTYHLQNPLALPTKMEIAIPPDTSFQKIYYQSLTPRPDNIFSDIDGNWIAVYNLAARERLDVRAMGTAQIFASPWKFSGTHSANLSASEYWEVDNPDIKELAATLATPENIYNYVVSTLSYNYDKVTTGAKRAGAVGALENPTGAICTEFTDLFVTLARAAGIPAREVNGYAYTDNSALKPLSLVADVLHAWPEYWDEDRKVWVPVDPTWGDTTGGVDYFSKLDMRHLSFVMHGASPVSPIPPGSYKLGANPQKDVFISFGELPEEVANEPTTTISQRTSLPFQGVVLVAQIENPGPLALYELKVELAYDNEKKYETVLPTLLPYEKKTLEFTVPYGFLGNSMPSEAVLFVGSGSASFITNKNPARVRDVAALALAIVFVSLGGFIYLKRRKK